MAGRRRGQIIPRGKGTWLIRVPRVGPDGKPKPWNQTFKGTKTEAQQALAAALVALEEGNLADAGSRRLADYLDQWIEVAAGARRESTVERYKWAIGKYLKPGLGGKRLDRLTALDIQEFLSDLLAGKYSSEPLSAGTVRYAHSVLSAALKQAVRWKLLPHNPCKDVDLPRLDKSADRNWLQEEQAARFLALAQEDLRGLPLILGLMTGMRPGEYLALRWEDLNWEAGAVFVQRNLHRPRGGGGWTLTEPKTKKSRRRVPLPRFALDLLRRHRARQAEERLAAGPLYRDNGFIFATTFGEPLHPGNLTRRQFRPLLAKAGLPASTRLYDLRHSAASLLLAAGEHPKVVADLLGHSSVTLTLDTYSHVAPSLLQDATAKLEGILRRGAGANSS